MSLESNQGLHESIEACGDCRDVCMETLIYCMEKGGRHAEVSHLKILMDCAEICALTVNFILRASEFEMDMARACAEVASRCAADCRRLGDDDAEMRRCAEACDACAGIFRRMFARSVA